MDELWGRVTKVHNQDEFQLELRALEVSDESQYEPLEEIKHKDGTVVREGDRVHVTVRERDSMGWLRATVLLDSAHAGETTADGANVWDWADPASLENEPESAPIDLGGTDDIGPADSATTMRRRRAGARFRRPR